MYNENQKNDFIKADSMNEVSLKNYFERIKEGELRYQKDFLTMNQDETISTLLLCKIRSISSRRHIISLLRHYADWAMSNGIVKNMPFIINISPEDIFNVEAYHTQMIKDPKQASEIIKEAYSNINYLDRTDRDAAVFWLLYSGVTLEEIPLLTIEHIFPNQNIIMSPKSSIRYSVSPEVIKYCEMTERLEKIERRVAHNPLGKVEYELVPTKYLFKPINSSDKNGKQKEYVNEAFVFNIVKYIFGLYGKNDLVVSPNNIRISGLYYRIYEREVNGEYLSERLFSEMFNSKKVKNLMEEYYEWKRAFGY